MAETLGSLCDKLIIVKLKEWHSEKQPERMRSLATQEQQLREKIDAFIADAASGRIPVERLTFATNKVYRKKGNAVHLAEVNCRLWHEVDKTYEIEKVPPDARELIVKRLAVLNLERTQCIDEIDRQLRAAVEQLQFKTIKH
jgi:hypothetical protein